MTIDEFKEFILTIKDISEEVTVIVEPYVTIQKLGSVWESQGFCFITAPFVNRILVEGYRGRSEEKMEKKDEERKLADLLYLHIAEVFRAFGARKIEYFIRPIAEETKIVS